MNKMILREVRMRKKRLVVAWIYYKKAYDTLPRSWYGSLREKCTSTECFLVRIFLH